MHQGHGGRGPAAQGHLAAGGAGVAEQALQARRGQHPRVVSPRLGEGQLAPGGEHHRPHLAVQGLGAGLQIDGAEGAGQRAGVAGLAPVPQARLRVDGGDVGHGAGVGHVDGPALREPLVGLPRHLYRANRVAGVTAEAGLRVHPGGPAGEIHLEVAHKAQHVGDLGASEQIHPVVVGHLIHQRLEHAGGAFVAGVQLREPGHLAADGGRPLHQGHLAISVGQQPGGGEAGHAAPHHQHVGVAGGPAGLQGVLATHPGHRGPDQVRRLALGVFALGGDPGGLLPDGGHGHEVGIDPGPLEDLAKGLPVLAGRAARHHRARLALGCGLLGELLGEPGASVLGAEGGVLADLHVRQGGQLLGQRAQLQGFAQDRSAATQIDADALGRRGRLGRLAAHGVTSTAPAGTPRPPGLRRMVWRRRPSGSMTWMGRGRAPGKAWVAQARQGS